MKKFLLSIFCCLMAVFAVQAEEVTYAVSTTSTVDVTGTAPAGSTATYKSTYSTKCQLTKNNSMTLTLSGYAGCKITGVTLSMKSNKSAGTGSFSMTAGETTLSSIETATFKDAAWNGAYTTTYVDVTPSMAVTDYTIANGEDVVITIAATVNSLYCQSFTIAYEVGGPVVPTAKKPVISPESCEFNLGESVNVTISSEEADAIIRYTLDGTEPTETSAVYTSSLTITQQTTVKAIAIIDGYKNSAIAEATYTAIDPNASSATLSFESAAQRVSITEEQQVWKQNGVTFINDQAASTTNVADYVAPVRCYKSSSITVETTRDMSVIEFDCSSASYAEDLQTSIGDYATVDGDKVVVKLPSATQSYAISSLSAQVRLDAITITYVYTLAVSEVGYATLFLGYNAIIPADVTCYAVTGIQGGYALMEEVTGVLPAETGVIVKASAGEYKFDATAETANVTSELKGSVANESISEEAYVLSAPNGVESVGLYKALMTDGSWLNNANKAYLPASVANGAVSYSFNFDWAGTTGIEGVEAEGVQNGKIYDITGREVKAITAPGIYIVNGAKVVVK